MQMRVLMVACCLMAGLAFWYSTQFEAGYFPYLLLLLCPVMHIFMHRGHDGGHGQ